MNKKWTTKMLTEGGIMIALSALLNQIPIYQAPDGGSVSAGGMVPIIIFAIRWGIGAGILVGSLYGLLDFIMKPYFFHPIQFILDYPLAYGLLGLAGLGWFYRQTNREGFYQYFLLIIGVGLGIGGRMLSHVLSGVVFFREAAGAQNPWLYSIGYNSTYLVPEFIISVIVLVLIWKPLKQSIKD